MSCYLQTGQKTCHNSAGGQIPCPESGQDAEFAKGMPWPSRRFQMDGETALDLLTGLTWTIDANPAGFPLEWQAAFDLAGRMCREQAHGFADWRLPNRRELRSLISHQTKNPALQKGHPFTNVFPGWYWTSAPAAVNPDFAWCVHLGGGRSFYGSTRQYYLLWPVRGEGNASIRCNRQQPRFEVEADGAAVADRLTNLRWRRCANLGQPVVWEEALEAAGKLSGGKAAAHQWRLPNINELESLVDLGRHNPALPPDHPFTDCRDVYWSSTTSMYQPDWAWALYMDKGAVGVGGKEYARFHAWAVSDVT